MSLLFQYVLTTVNRRRQRVGEPFRLPDTAADIPYGCCHGGWRCRAEVAWRIGDGRNRLLFCAEHIERFWQADHDVQDFTVERWMDG